MKHFTELTASEYANRQYFEFLPESVRVRVRAQVADYKLEAKRKHLEAHRSMPLHSRVNYRHEFRAALSNARLVKQVMLEAGRTGSAKDKTLIENRIESTLGGEYIYYSRLGPVR